jgi:sec-independent protein translocase protein TatA
MFGIGVPELLITLVIVVIIFGVGKLPEIGPALGKGIKNFKKSVNSDNTSANPPSKKKTETSNHRRSDKRTRMLSGNHWGNTSLRLTAF